MAKHPLVITLMGPTASGKTALALKLVETMNCEIISVDSALIYKDMDIGTAKPTKEELAVAPHRLIDILDPIEAYSVAEFRRDAIKHIEEIVRNGKTPLLVGGTMMYFNALLNGLSELPEADQNIRRAIEAEVANHGWQHMHDQLALVDPVSAKRIHPNDPQRLMRAIEVFRISGKSLTELTESKSARPEYDFLQLAIAPEKREVLHDRIALRFRQMLDSGFQKEVEALRARGDLHIDMPSMRCVGYRQMWQYLDGDFDEQEMEFRGVVATRQLAKRQMTWLRGWSELNWLDTFAENNLAKIMDMIEDRN